MKQTIRLQDIYSADLYTRSRASELRRGDTRFRGHRLYVAFVCRRGVQHH